MLELHDCQCGMLLPVLALTHNDQRLLHILHALSRLRKVVQQRERLRLLLEQERNRLFLALVHWRIAD